MGAIPLAAQVHTVEGAVVGADDQPLSGASVRLIRTPSELQRITDLFAMAEGREQAFTAESGTGIDGRFVVTVPGPGPWQLQFSAPGATRIVRHVEFASGTVELPKVRLVRADRTVFTVLDGSDAPVANALVVVDFAAAVEDDTAGDQSPVAAWTNDDGEATVLLGRGAGTVNAVALGYMPLSEHRVNLMQVRTEAGRREAATVRLEEGVPHRVQITLDGEALPDAQLMLNGSQLPTGFTDPNGWAEVAVSRPEAQQQDWLTVLGSSSLLHHHVSTVPQDPSNRGAVSEELSTQRIALESQSITGRVVDRDERPVPGAAVWTTDPRSEVTSTNARGQFQLVATRQFIDTPSRQLGPAFKAHQTQIHADAGGFVRTTGPLSKDPVLVLERARKLEVRVSSADGDPLANVQLTLSVREPKPTFQRKARSRAITAANGVAVFERLEPSTAYNLRAFYTGYRLLNVEVAPAAASGPVRRMIQLVFEPGAVHSGRVQSEDGVVASGVLVEVIEPTPANRMQRVWEAYIPPEGLASSVSDVSGRFEIRDAPVGAARLRLSGPGFAQTEIEGLDLPEYDADLGDVTIRTGHPFEGRVVDEEGASLPGVRLQLVGLINPNGSDGSVRETTVTAAENGEFKLTQLAAGNYGLSVSAKAFGSYRKDIELPLSEPMTVELRRGIALPVRVVDGNGGTLRSASVSFRLRDLEVKVGRGDAHLPEGRGVLYGVVAGEMLFDVSGPSGGGLTAHAVTISESGQVMSDSPEASWDGTELVFTLGGKITLSGTVATSSGDPILRGAVHGFPRLWGAIENGHYELTGLDEGALLLDIKVEGYPNHRERIKLGDELHVIHDVRLEEGWRIAGQVVDRSGQPVAGAEVVVSSTDRFDFTSPSEVLSDEGGAFVVGPLLNGTYGVGAKKKGFASGLAIDPILVKDDDVSGVTVELSKGGSVFGRILGLEPEEFVGLEIRTESMGTGTVRVFRDGRYRISGLSEGVHQLGLSGRALQKTVWRTATVPAGEDVEMDFVVADHRLTGVVVREGQPLKGVVVRLRDADQSHLGAVSTDNEGRFQIEHLDEGTATLKVFVQGSLLHEQSIDVFGDQDLVITVDAVDLRGRVVAPDGSPIEGARVHLRPPSGGTLSQVFAVSDEEGLFSMPIRNREVPPAGPYLVTVSARGYGSVVREWGGDAESFLEVQLSDRAPLEIRWLDRSPTSAIATLVDGSGRAVHQTSVGHGKWTISDAPIGEWTLHLVSGLAQVSAPVGVESASDQAVVVDLAWPRTAQVSVGWALAPPTDPTRPLRMRLLDATGRIVQFPRRGGLSPWQTAVAISGRYEMAVGDWVYEFLRGEEVVSRKEITVFPDGTSVVRETL